MSSRKTETVAKQNILKRKKIMDTIYSSANDCSDSADSNGLGRWRISISGR